jgi:hypothetical protein
MPNIAQDTWQLFIRAAALAKAGGGDARAGHKTGAAGNRQNVPGCHADYRGISAKRIWSRRSTALLPRTTFGGLDLGRRA